MICDWSPRGHTLFCPLQAPGMPLVHSIQAGTIPMEIKQHKTFPPPSTGSLCFEREDETDNFDEGTRAEGIA